MSAEPVGQLAQALDAAGQLVAAVRAEQWPDPTPCPDWNGRDLVSHILAGNRMFASILLVAPPWAPAGSPPAGPGQPGEDLPSAYRDAASGLLAAFRPPGCCSEHSRCRSGRFQGSPRCTFVSPSCSCTAGI